MKSQRIKKGDYVTRKSYGKDVLFNVEKVIKLSNGTENAILKGTTYRIKADSPLEDLCIVNKKTALDIIKKFDLRLIEACKNTNCKENYIETAKRTNIQVKTGTILHLDGDNCLGNKKSPGLINI